MVRLGVATLLAALCVCTVKAQPGMGAANASLVSVSGVSSGAFFAVQLQVAHSQTIMGAGIVAGGPYWCAQDDVALALSLMSNPSLIVTSQLVAATSYAYSVGSIDNPAYLKSHRVWLFSGTLDTVVNPGVMHKLVDYYSVYIPSSSITTVFDVPVEHSIVTDSWGNACSYLGPDYINNCNYDSAGVMLQNIYAETFTPRTVANNSHIFEIDQAAYIPYAQCPFQPNQMGLYSSAFAYIPPQCQSGAHSCKLHVAFHGCLQSIPNIGNSFYTNAGYNQWAESNDLIILYPQADSNTLNPKACWDWWGYSGVDYATKLGCQIATINAMIAAFTQ